MTAMEERRAGSGYAQRPERVAPAQQSCTAKATSGFVSGTVLGATMSGLSGMARAAQMQMRFPAAVQGVIGATIIGGLSFGAALGAYQGTVCAIRQVRGVDDVKNPVMAGAIVGAMSEIPVFLRSKVITKSDLLAMEQGLQVVRPRPRFLFNACAGAVVCGLFYTAADVLRQDPVPKPQPPPQAPPAHGGNEGRELETWGSLESQENNGDWVVTEPPVGEVLESEDLGWGSK